MESSILSFGVSAVDMLLGTQPPKVELGIYADEGESTSLCLVGPDGVGKSIFALHIASHYAAQYMRSYPSTAKPDLQPPCVIYASTDLSHIKAKKVWKTFGLEWPKQRANKLHEHNLMLEAGMLEPDKLAEKIILQSFTPVTLSKYLPGAEHLDQPANPNEPPKDHYANPPKVAFLDLQANTAGDDWAFLVRVLELLKGRSPGVPHLLIIDAVEGLQTLGGSVDSFGEHRERRSRIAQLIRTATNNCHVVFMVEEPKGNELFPEQFVTDSVVRLRVEDVGGGYLRRSIEVEKVRAQNHVRGQHTFTIRSGNGSTTGFQINPDDLRIKLCIPKVEATNEEGHNGSLAYLHVFPSLDYRYSQFLHQLTIGRQGITSEARQVLGFGLRYLDNMLLIGPKDPTANAGSEPSYGLPAATVSVIIGPPKTYKSPLSRAFLSQAFNERAFLDIRDPVNAVGTGQDHHVMTIQEFAEMFSNQVTNGKTLLQHYSSVMNVNPPAGKTVKQVAQIKDDAYQAYRIKANEFWDERLKAKGKSPGFIVYFSTEDIDSSMLAGHCFRWLDKTPSNVNWENLPSGPNSDDDRMRAQKMILYESRILCRRLEIHTTGSSGLFRIITETVCEGLRRHTGMQGDEPSSPEERSSAANVRVVIDNWGVIENMYPSVREDPLFLPALVFRLRRLGVTTLIVETRTEGDSKPAVYQTQSPLAELVDNSLYTWNVPFHGHRMVAISPLAAFSADQHSVIREVKPYRRQEEPLKANAYDPETSTCYVDPHLEIYGNLATGEPKDVPLKVRLFTESEGGQEHALRTNRLFRSMFTPIDIPNSEIVTQTRSPIDENAGIRYARLHDSAFLHPPLLDHTRVEQVDEFWAMDGGPFYRSLKTYLMQTIREVPGTGKADLDDPFRLFRHLQHNGDQEFASRIDAFDLESLAYGHPSDINSSKEDIDRAPYTWEFGFTLCRQNLWKRNFTRDLKNLDRLPGVGDPDPHGNLPKPIKVKEVWQQLSLNDLCGSIEPDQPKDQPSPRRATDTLDDHPEPDQSPDQQSVGLAVHSLDESEGHIPPTVTVSQKVRSLKEFTETSLLDGRNAALRSWRVFLEACKVVQEGSRQPPKTDPIGFELPAVSAECLFLVLLEIWLSEMERFKGQNQVLSDQLDILRDSKHFKGEPRIALSKILANTNIDPVGDLQIKEATEWFADEFWQSPNFTSTQESAPKEHHIATIALFKAFCLLHEIVVSMGGLEKAFADIGTPTHSDAVAARHWYSSASRTMENFDVDDPTHPLRLPGRYTTRGDWFIAIAQGSRSTRLGERAMDVLSSVHSNAERLELGIGLPTRKLAAVRVEYANIETALKKVPLEESAKTSDGEEFRMPHASKINYSELLKLGGPRMDLVAKTYKFKTEEFNWLWRSSIKQYDQHSRVWQLWVKRVLTMFEDARISSGADYMRGFDMYDSLSIELGWWAEGGKLEGQITKEAKKRSFDECGKYSVRECAEFKKFGELVVDIIQKIKFTTGEADSSPATGIGPAISEPRQTLSIQNSTPSQ